IFQRQDANRGPPKAERSRPLNGALFSGAVGFMPASNTEEELADLRAEMIELRRQLDEIRSAFRFHGGKLLELCIRQARVQDLTFGPSDDANVQYGSI